MLSSVSDSPEPRFFVDGKWVSARECHRLFGGLPSLEDRQRRCLAMIEGRRILDIGCYTGAFVVEASRRSPARQVFGVDYFVEHIRIARFVHPELRHRFFPMSAYALAVQDESLDCVTLQEVIEHLEGAASAIKEINRVLRPGGTLILTTNNPYYWRDVLSFAGSEFKNAVRRMTSRRAKLEPVVFFNNVEWNRHIYCWTPPTLMSLLHINGFRYVDHSYANEHAPRLNAFVGELLPFMRPTQVIKVRKVAPAPRRLV